MKTCKRLIAVLLLGPVLAMGWVAAAYAHGEKAQEAFLRMQTVAFFDTKFATDKPEPGDITLKQGEEWTVEGTMKILETWPKTIDEPEVGYIGVTTQGPVSIMTGRVVNGKDTPHSIYLGRGDVFNYKMTLQGRMVGRWHVHPIIGVEGAGSVMGPGRWLTVTEAPGGFSFPVTLMNGETVDLENYGISLVWTLNLLGLVLGLWFMWHWTVPRATVTRLMINLKIGMHDTGDDFGLIQPKDYKVMDILAVLTIALLIGGYWYGAATYPGGIPQQVIRFEPPKAHEDPNFVKVSATQQAKYDVAEHTLVLPFEVTNTGNTAMSVTLFTTSTLTFMNNASEGRRVIVEPSDAIYPNETKSLTLSMRDAVWEEERMMPIGEALMSVTGVVTFENQDGQKNRITVQMPLNPSSFTDYAGAAYF
jgi:methane/ammonia monooxygenase subunit B